MKQETIGFQQIPAAHQNRFSDRVSFLYVEYAKIVQSDSGVIALTKDEDGEYTKVELQLPVASVALLQLGPGTSITTAALTSCARSGCVVQFTSGGGLSELSTAVPLTT